MITEADVTEWVQFQIDSISQHDPEKLTLDQRLALLMSASGPTRILYRTTKMGFLVIPLVEFTVRWDEDERCWVVAYRNRVAQATGPG